MTLRYPKGIDVNFTDYIMFTPHEYRTNKRYSGQNEMNGPMPPGAVPIILYMPNTTPPVSNNNGWENNGMAGEFGALAMNAGVGLASAINGAGDQNTSVEGYKSKLKQLLEKSKSNAGPALKQVATNEISQQLTGNRNTLMAVQRGQVVNPNVELIYQSPSLRGFNFNFTFSPMNQTETIKINEIIKSTL